MSKTCCACGKSVDVTEKMMVRIPVKLLLMLVFSLDPAKRDYLLKDLAEMKEEAFRG